MATFKDLEHAGWAQKARAYDDWLVPVTLQAIGPMLASLCETYEGERFLPLSHLPSAMPTGQSRRPPDPDPCQNPGFSIPQGA